MALALTASAGLRSTARKVVEPDRELFDYQRDLLEPFDVEYDEDRLLGGGNVGHSDLAEALLERPGVAGCRPDLVLLAYAVPDVHPLRSVSAHVNHLLGGGARSMAISEQGLAAPYTALRLARAFHRSGRCERALVLVLEQTTLPYHDPLVHDTPLSDTAAALVLDRGGPVFGVPWSGPGGELAGLVAVSHPDTHVVAGPWVPPLTGRNVTRCPAGTYCTSVWLALADRDPDRPLLLCDLDPRTGTAHAVTVHPAGKDPR
ncbi:hypothetical protein [Amycolatopsis sp. PS_44_ISF1]|uniref:hypothetical protein n=1 Tax=Amycolatopsis sp. PS_44_ISF1 TaxID=2974917 RepID=UPI0028DD7FCE|nr:hypothetical protein [Amycolatopsis sp. PS_44_ISF1]MDT8912951.1 hypothetical protein [Amycolatopsis sp. PS_44_ISF1]